MTDETPTPENPESPEAVAPEASAPTEPTPTVGSTPPEPPAPAAAAAPAAAVTSARRRQVAVPVWALTLIAAILGAAVMFGVGYAVGDSGHDGDDRGSSQFGGDFPAPGRGGFGQGQGQQGQGQFPGQGRGGFGQGQQGQGQLPGGNGGGTQQLPVPGGGGSGSGSGQTPSAPTTSGAFLGVATQQDSAGVKITQIASGSAAEKAGLSVGDVITSFNGRAVTTPTALGTAVANLQPGDRVTLEVDRNGTSDTVTVTLGSRSTTNSN